MQSEPINNINQTTTWQSIANLKLVHSGEDYFLCLRNIITKAKHEIHIQVYIFENDSIGLDIADELINAANRQVKVYILVDGYGSAKLPDSFLENLREHGIQIRFFSPFFSRNNFYLGRRLHHKVVVVDGQVALIGGINISNKYRGSSTEQPWLDYAVQLESASTVESVQQLCRNIYLKKQRNHVKTIPSHSYNDHETWVKILRNDWVKQRNEICNAYINAIRKADSEIIIVGSYFLPGIRLSSALKSAARRGVKVKIILSGVSDLPLVMRATQYLYSILLKQDIELFEWKKSVLHGKLMVVDAKWATIGSFNLNYLSSYGSIEMNVEIDSSEFSKNVCSYLTSTIEQCDKITNQTHKIRNDIVTRFKNWIAYRLVRMALIIVTYIPYNRFWEWHQFSVAEKNKKTNANEY